VELKGAVRKKLAALFLEAQLFSSGGGVRALNRSFRSQSGRAEPGRTGPRLTGAGLAAPSSVVRVSHLWKLL